MEKMNKLENFLEAMWKDYCSMNPQAYQIYSSLVSKGESVQNDHIALRTVNHPRLGIKSLSQHFEKYGYVASGEYFFKEKKLYAQHFENKQNPLFPKIFISELELEKLSPLIQSVYSSIIPTITDQALNDEKIIYNGKSWVAEYSIYNQLAQESEYASWLYAFGFRPNHFTISVNHLNHFRSLKEVNDHVKSLGIKLNISGGEVKGTAEELLEQSSTMANHIEVEFKEGRYQVPACYYEFARRYQMPNGQYYQGFIAQSADKIFESTNKH